ncbi:type II toxin-antitoxin system Phd/YefM family antitoxin [Streptomyces sp. sk2.1]|uniref:type II toxin-antitoxin system Phd/YefM family antitoxin n=1 Tax=Streptomyces sp. sk2.1 TaxID=2478959 RepID=UPI0011E6E245|nr:type II toxin-antitoxin system Phd/YefM family antitoxin [Streptomyces sp. sk2.1]TXS68919.1 type II toxin-antitoxin system Phd/YefM family antitoxin [Streptomyces sp. sk2.1]
MEKSYGIEAARAQLGDIADHARTTGQVIALTRHGRTIAVIGPVKAVRPDQGIKMSLHFPHADWTVQLPVVPRTGEFFEWEDPQHGSARWEVTEVIHVADPNEAYIAITLDPADEEARKQVNLKPASKGNFRTESATYRYTEQ